MDLDAIIKALAELNITFDGLDYARERVLDRLSLLHPDRTGGQFQPSQQQSEFQQLLDFRDALAKQTSVGNQLIPINPSSPETLSIRDSSTRAILHSVAAEAAVTDRYRQHTRRGYALPKITSAILASLCIASISLLGTLRNNPLYRVTVNYLTRSERQALFEEVNRAAQNRFRRWGDVRLLLIRFPELSGTPMVAEYREVNFGGYSDSRSRIRVDLFTSDDSPLLKNLDLAVSDANTKLSSQLSKDSKLLIQQVTTARDQRESGRFSNEGSMFERDLYEPLSRHSEDEKASQISEDMAKRFFGTLQQEVGSIGASNKQLEAYLVDSKTSILQTADSVIFRDLVVLIILFCLVFAITWARERSDERWVEYLSSDQGLQFVFERIRADQRIIARNPPRFTLGELTAEISKKEVQAILRPILGRYLDIRYLGQLSTLMMGKLTDKKVIKQIDSKTIESWFEITGKNGHSENQDPTATN